jgi:hypothetical protein
LVLLISRFVKHIANHCWSLTCCYLHQIPVAPELLNEAEALYALQDHPVFELVPCAFHEHATKLFVAIGQPKITIHNFWDVYLDLLKRLCDGSDEALTGILSSHQQNLAHTDQQVHLLPDMEPLRLGQLLNVRGREINYIGGLDDASSAPAPGPEYADFTSDEDDDGNNED